MRGRKEMLSRAMRKLLGVMDIFIILIIMIASLVHTMSKYHIAYFKYGQVVV